MDTEKTFLISADKNIKTIDDYEKIVSKEKKYNNKSFFGGMRIFYQEDKGKACIGFETKKKTITYKIESKKKTVSNVVKDPLYWVIRENVIGKPKEDRFNKDKVRKEVDEYYKSICSYVKDKEFNQDFFIKNDPGLKWFWGDDEVWATYTTVR